MYKNVRHCLAMKCVLLMNVGLSVSRLILSVVVALHRI